MPYPNPLAPLPWCESILRVDFYEDRSLDEGQRHDQLETGLDSDYCSFESCQGTKPQFAAPISN